MAADRQRRPRHGLVQRTQAARAGGGALAGAGLAALVLAAAAGAQAPTSAAAKTAATWAAGPIARVTTAGLFGGSAAGFDPQAPLTEQALAAAIAATDRIQHPVADTPVPGSGVQVLSTIPANATLAGTENWQITVPDQSVSSVDFTIDGVQRDVVSQAPFAYGGGNGQLVTTAIANGTHQLAVAAHLDGGATYVATWDVAVANGAGLTPAALPSSPSPVPLTSTPVPAATTAASGATAAASALLYRAVDPAQPVTIRQLDSALVGYLGLDGAAKAFQTQLEAGGLDPGPNTGSEVVARLLDLRFSHTDVALQLLPDEDATRAEAAYSFARVLALAPSSLGWVDSLAQQFSLPALDSWQTRILRTAVSYVGYPYVWGGTNATAEAPFGVEAPGGFDCSGFVWRVYKLTSYPGEGDLAATLRGRTTYEMSGEVPRAERIPAAKLEPGDVMFFGEGPRSKPSEVDHTGIYLGNGWLIDSSSEGVTLEPFSGWYASSFAWARRPLREAGLVSAAVQAPDPTSA